MTDIHVHLTGQSATFKAVFIVILIAVAAAAGSLVGTCGPEAVVSVALWGADLFTGDDRPYQVAVALPLTGPDSKAGQEVFEAALRYWNQNAATHRVMGISLMPYDDKDDTAIAREVAQQLVDDDKVLAVIGPFSSSTAKAVMPTYIRGNKSEGELPVIMPVPTATTTTALAGKLGGMATLRLPPNNQKQAEDGIHFCSQKLRAETYAIVRDQTNPEYSNDLGYAFKREISKAGEKVVFDIGVGGHSGRLWCDCFDRSAPIA